MDNLRVKQEPLVSIGMPVFNGGLYIRQALDSLLDQAHENLELIISDNASTDQTPALCYEFAKRDSRVHYHQNETNIGVVSNFLRVLELAHGDYFMWAACDDLWMPDFIRDIVHSADFQQSGIWNGKKVAEDLSIAARNRDKDLLHQAWIYIQAASLNRLFREKRRGTT